MKKRHKWEKHQFKGKDGEYHTSHSVCMVCDLKRKTWRYRPDQYQYPDGKTVLVGPGFEKVPPCKEWHIILFDSCACSGDLEVFTNAGPDKFNEGDPVQCRTCEKLGSMVSDKESSTNYRISWY